MFDIIRLEQGINNIKFVTKPHMIYLHKIAEKDLTVICGLKNYCELCNGGLAYQTWYAGIKNNNNGGVYNILNLNNSLYRAIQTFVRASGDPSNFDLTIERQDNKFELKSFNKSIVVDSEVVLDQFKFELNQLTSPPNESQVQIMHSNNYDLSKLDESYNCFIKHDIKKQNKQQLELKCDGCSRPNDVGVKKCWWCEKVFTG